MLRSRVGFSDARSNLRIHSPSLDLASPQRRLDENRARSQSRRLHEPHLHDRNRKTKTKLQNPLQTRQSLSRSIRHRLTKGKNFTKSKGMGVCDE